MQVWENQHKNESYNNKTFLCETNLPHNNNYFEQYLCHLISDFIFYFKLCMPYLSFRVINIFFSWFILRFILFKLSVLWKFANLQIYFVKNTIKQQSDDNNTYIFLKFVIIALERIIALFFFLHFMAHVLIFRHIGKSHIAIRT